MELRIAASQIDSLAELTGQGQKLVKTMAFGLPMNPTHPRMKAQRFERACESNLRSVGVSRETIKGIAIPTCVVDERLLEGTDAEIEALVYGLTEEETAIVEQRNGSTI